MTALYAESGQHSNGYSRLATDPGGPNEIVMFKSCFPNSELRDAGRAGAGDRRQPAEGTGLAAARLGGLHGGQRQGHLPRPARVLRRPPREAVRRRGRAAGRRHRTPPAAATLANWLVDHWLQDSGYSAGNVLVFDLYNVLTSKTGGGASDVGLASGNHHRVWNGAVQHKTDDGADRLAYPTAAATATPPPPATSKATAEFVPLLNAAYNAWKGNGGGDTVGPRTYAPRRADGAQGRAGDAVLPRDRQRLGERHRDHPHPHPLRRAQEDARARPQGHRPLRHVHFTCRLARGVYRFTVYARDLSGNAAQPPLGSNRLTVR